MPLLDSFTVDHTRMEAPAVRVAKTMQTPNKDTITVFDLRFCVPNQEILSERGIHTLEHLFAGFMRDHLNGNGVEIIDISPMGCRTGFYMSLIGAPDEARVGAAWQAAMSDVLTSISAVPTACTRWKRRTPSPVMCWSAVSASITTTSWPCRKRS